MNERSRVGRLAGALLAAAACLGEASAVQAQQSGDQTPAEVLFRGKRAKRSPIRKSIRREDEVDESSRRLVARLLIAPALFITAFFLAWRNRAAP